MSLRENENIKCDPWFKLLELCQITTLSLSGSKNYNVIVFNFQVENAANYGAKAALLYSDPADYAKAGGDPENTYPKTAWLPASGVQRGSLYTFPGNGDPQTPGIAALPGMYRRWINDSQLPSIPAHAMGYGDAIKFLSKIGGELGSVAGVWAIKGVWCMGAQERPREREKLIPFPLASRVPQHAHALYGSSACDAGQSGWVQNTTHKGDLPVAQHFNNQRSMM